MRVLAALFVLSATATAAFAHPAGGAAVREACRADVAALCQGIQPGGGRIRACLRANKDRLSEGCKSAIAALIQARRAARNASPAQPQAPGTGAPPVMGPVAP